MDGENEKKSDALESPAKPTMKYSKLRTPCFWRAFRNRNISFRLQTHDNCDDFMSILGMTHAHI